MADLGQDLGPAVHEPAGRGKTRWELVSSWPGLATQPLCFGELHPTVLVVKPESLASFGPHEM